MIKDSKYAHHIVEIQVASILMHAWSEVNHDLAYKPSSGELSEQELSILDGLNGLVLTGEVLLEQLQSAFQNRVSHQTQPFDNQYELATFIYQSLEKDSIDKLKYGIILMGDTNRLFHFLKNASIATPKNTSILLNSLGNYIDDFSSIANEMIESALQSNPKLINIYLDMFWVLDFVNDIEPLNESDRKMLEIYCKNNLF